MSSLLDKFKGMAPTQPAPTTPLPSSDSTQQVAGTSYSNKLLDKFKAGGATITPAPTAQLLSKHPTGSATQLAKSKLAAFGLSSDSLPAAPVLEKIPALAPLAPIVEAATPPSERVEKNQLTYELANPEQRKAVDLALTGQSFVLIGSAGTGKTATQGLLTQSLLAQGKLLPNYQLGAHKYLPQNALSILICTFMNKAANNMRKAVQQDFKSNVITIHKALEYAPTIEYVEWLNPDTNEMEEKERKVFRPQRGLLNKLEGLTHIIIEEAGTVSTDLEQELRNALPNNGNDICWIYLGDLKQIPPVFGQSILSKKLLELPVIELTRVYRQALESPIKRFAIDINEGKPISDEVLQQEYAKPGELEFFNFSGKRQDGTVIGRKAGSDLVKGMARYFSKAISAGDFVPFRDIILIPFRVNPGPENKNHNGLNCDYLNKLIADAVGKAREAEVFEVQAGMFKKYLAIGDPVFHEKYEYTIVGIHKNSSYKGLPPKQPSIYLDREGNYSDPDMQHLNFEMTLSETLSMDVSGFLEGAASGDEDDDEEKSKAASHIITLKLHTDDPEDEERVIELSTAGAVGKLEFAYATTVHKSIGSEWEKVYCIFHHSMISMLSRELVYTAVTRAKSYLAVFYDGKDWSNLRKLNSSVISHAILNPEIKGITLDEKLAWLKVKAAQQAELKGNLLSKFSKPPESTTVPPVE